jgi:hypothetical protein
MKSLLKSIAFGGLFWLLVASPTAAQITSKLVFETSFPFYAGNSKMPPGTYTVTQGDSTEPVLQIENTTGTHTAFLDYISTSAESPHAQTDVTFNKYGKVDFLNLLWVQGQNQGMQIVQTKAEQLAAKTASQTRHSVPAKNGG